MLDPPRPMGAGLMPTAPVSPVSTQQPAVLGIAFSWLLGRGRGVIWGSHFAMGWREMEGRSSNVSGWLGMAGVA